MITIRSRSHAALVLRHLRVSQRMSRIGLGRRLYVSAKTIANRERGDRGMAVEVLIDSAHALGHTVTLIPARHPGTRPTGTGWPT